MALPSELQQMMDDALAAMRADPKQEIGSTRRKAIYDWMRTNEQGKRARKWLEIITAEKVLPIYEAKLPEQIDREWSPPEDVIKEVVESGDIYQIESHVSMKRLARRMIEVATGVIRDTFNREIAEKLANNLYHTCFNAFDFAEQDGVEFSQAICTALAAASSSVKVAVGFDPFDHLGVVSRVGVLVDNEWFISSKPISSDLWSDRELAGTSSSDAAASAMAAWASDDHDRLIPEKIVEFWTWWLTEAIPQAWEKAAS
jgi:hypothetical protein